MKIEIKNVQYSEFASEDSYCFTATIYIDGVKSGTASDDGMGGETVISPDATRKKINEYAKTLPKWVSSIKNQDGSFQEIEYDAEILINDLMTDYLYIKDLKRALSKRILFTRAGSDDIYETKIYKKAHIEHFLSTLDKSLASLKADRILNAMPIEDALAIYRKK